MGSSENTARKVGMDPEEFRELLAGQFKAEVAQTVWSRVRNLLTGGGVLSISLILGAAWYLDSTIKTTARDAAVDAVDRARPGMVQEVSRVARDSAGEAVRADIAAVERVRARVEAQLPDIVREVLARDPALKALIEAQVREATEQQLKDAGWRRGMERTLMAQQARDPGLPTMTRVFALSDLLREAEGVAAALSVLSETAERLPDAAWRRNEGEAPFLRMGSDVYARRLAERDEGRPPRAEHERLLNRLARLTAEEPQREGPLEGLLRPFGSAPDITWLARRAREAEGGARAAFLQALVSHPSEEAADRVEALLCARDVEFARALLEALAARAEGHNLKGDEAGAKFLRISACVEEAILAQRLPAPSASHPDCAGDASLEVLWRARQLPSAATRRRVLERIARSCPDSLIAQVQAGREAPLRWSRPGGAAAPADITRALAGLLPGPVEGTEPIWLRDLAAGEGLFAALLQAPHRNLALIALTLDRLEPLPPGETVTQARLRLALGLAGALRLEGRPAERLLLDLVEAEGSGEALCAPLADRLGATGRAASPLVAAQVIRCLSRDRNQPAEAMFPAALAVMTGALRQAEPLRRGAVLELLAQALQPSAQEGGGAARVLDWMAAQAEIVSPDRWQEPMAAALAALVESAEVGISDALLAADQPTRARLDRWRHLVETRPLGTQPLREAAPHVFDAGFASQIGSDATRPQAAAGRFWLAFRPAEGMELRWPAGAGAPALLLSVADDGALVQEPIFQNESGAPSARLMARRHYLLALDSPARLQQAAMTAPMPLPWGERRTGLGTAGQRSFPYLLEAGRHYEFRTDSLEANLDTVIRLTDTEGRLLPEGENDDDPGRGLASRICVRATSGGLHWLEVSHYSGRLPQPLSFTLAAAEVAGCR